jgi:predicted nucleic acid-binding protein
MSTDRYLFEVGALTIAFAGTPVSENALDYVRKGISGEISAVIPTTALLGTYHILRRRYNFPRNRAKNVVTNILDAHRIKWHSKVSVDELQNGLSSAQDHSIQGWDGYYSRIAQKYNATVLTIDSDFEDIPDVSCELVLTEDEMEELTEYMRNEGLID